MDDCCDDYAILLGDMRNLARRFDVLEEAAHEFATLVVATDRETERERFLPAERAAFDALCAALGIEQHDG
jgi:hypothetical protein